MLHRIKHITLTVAIFSLAFINTLLAQNSSVLFAEFPQRMALIPRNPANNIALVNIEGTIQSTTVQDMLLLIYRNGQSYRQTYYPLSYTNGNASFSFMTQLEAGLFNYTFEIYTVTGSINDLVKRTDSIVVGDVYLVQGGQNASSIGRVGAANPVYQNPFIRTFGYKGTDPTLTQNDLRWRIADGDAGYNTSDAVGQFALILAKNIVANQNMPVAIINGAEASTTIAQHQRNDFNQADLATNYGRLLYRCQKAGIVHGVRGVLFYQGEGDAANSSTYLQGLEDLRTDWQNNFINLTRIFLFQINLGCTPTSVLQVQTIQRNFANAYTNVELVSTNGVLGRTNGGCHYTLQGNVELARRAYLLVSGIFYGGSMVHAQAPDVAPNGIEFSNVFKNELVITLKNPFGPLSIVGSSTFYSDFVIEGSPNVQVIDITVSGDKIYLLLSTNATNAVGVSYLGHVGDGLGWIVNQRNIGLVSFFNQAINAGNTPQPVEWLGVWATQTDDALRSATIVWTLGSQTNNNGFEVIDVWNGAETVLGFVAGRTNSNETKTYTFKTQTLEAGKHIFKIKQIDHDARFTYSKSVALTVLDSKKAIIYALYPNPTAGESMLTIEGLDENETLTLNLFDLQGRWIQHIETSLTNNATNFLVKIDAQGLEKGIYILKIETEQGIKTMRWIKN